MEEEKEGRAKLWMWSFPQSRMGEWDRGKCIWSYFGEWVRDVSDVGMSSEGYGAGLSGGGDVVVL